MNLRTRNLSAIFIVAACCVVLFAYIQTSSAVRIGQSQDESPSINFIKKDFVFGDERPFAQCHASTLVKADDGNFVVAWFGGTYEKHDDVGIWISKGNIGKWSAPVEIAKLREDPHWNPVLFKTLSGEIILYFKVGRTIDEWETWVMTSRDNGTTWSEAVELVPGDKGGRGPVRNKPVILSNGTWLAPASNEKDGVWNAFVDLSEDQGTTWKASPFIAIDRSLISGAGIIQPALWESSPGKIHMLLRSSAGVICRSDSDDYGETWSPVYKTNLPNPNSGIDLTKLSDGILLLVYNPVGKNWGPRNPISVAVSADNGTTWSKPLNLESGTGDQEFSYPAVVHHGDTVAGTFTWKRQRILFWYGVVK